jgi:integrase
MSVYPERRGGRLTGKWIAEVTRDGERQRKRFESKYEGERWADTISLTGAAPVEAVKPLGKTLGFVASEARENSPKSSRDGSRDQRLEYVVRFLGKDTPVQSIKKQNLEALVKDLKKRPGVRDQKLSGATINRYLTLASSLLTYAYEKEYIQGMPKVPWQEEVEKRIYWLPKDGEDKVLKELEDRGSPECALAVRVLVATGMRWGEFESLEPSQVDGEWIRLWETKTKRPRSVPISVGLAKELKLAIEQKRLPNYTTLRNRLTNALKSAGQNPAVTIHGLRHTTATRLIQNGVNLRIVQRYLGHSNIATTTRYAHVADEDLLAASKKISPHAGQSPVLTEIPAE